LVSYKWFGQCKHSLCNAHLLRDLTYIGEAEPPHEGWTTPLAKLLIEIKDAVEAARHDSQTELDREQHEDFYRRYDALTAQAQEAVRGSPEQKSAGLTAGKLLNRFIRNKVEDAFDSTCYLPYAGFGTDVYKLTVLNRGEVIANAND
jgi:hypothetical protein